MVIIMVYYCGIMMKTVLITGCSSGIGRELVGAFLGSGWRVIATMRRLPERRALFKSELSHYKTQLVLQELDVASATDRAKLVLELGDAPLDCLVNNAGFALFGALENAAEEQIIAQINVNLTAPILLTQALLPKLRASKGSIINISSMMSFVGFPLSSIYCTSKAGLSMFSESMYHELAPHGVRVALIEPGGYRTNFSSNIQWSNRNEPAYQKLTEGYKRLQKRISSRKGRSPSSVIQKIVTIAEAKSTTKLKYRIGADSLLSGLFHKLCPNGLRLRILRRMFRKLFS